MENLNSIIILILLVILFLSLIRLFISIIVPKIKGMIGEIIVSLILKSFQSKNYIIINNITIKTNDSTTQIDHLVICPFGIVVIETKFYKGWIFGSEESFQWTQVIYNEKFKFLNPIIQNKTHIKALKYYLTKYPNIPYYSIIVLCGSSEFKSYDKITTPVIYPKYLRKTINELVTGKQQVLTWENMIEVRNIISSISFKDKNSKKEHVRNVKSKKIEAHNAVKMGRCPKCDGVLVEREGEYGKFLGCSNYPKCKFTTK